MKKGYSSLISDTTAEKLMMRNEAFWLFVVSKAKDLCTGTHRQDAIRDLGDRLKKGGVGLFFYAGHAVQVIASKGGR